MAPAMKLTLTRLLLSSALISANGTAAFAASFDHTAPDGVIAAQRARLTAATRDKGYGPQSPRDIDNPAGENQRVFSLAPAAEKMNLCNIHLHENAEHKGGQFTTYAGNGDGEGNNTGYKYDGELTDAERAPLDRKIGESEHGDLRPGDTIEAHFVYSTAQVQPGESLNACVNEAIVNPELRVEAQVFVLVNDRAALNFAEIARIEQQDGLYQAPNLPANTGAPVEYEGSTTGPGYNEKASPYEVTWRVRPEVLKVDIESVAAWLSDNPFKERHAHGVRNLVEDPALLSDMPR